MTGSRFVNHLDQQIELKYFSDYLKNSSKLMGRIGLGMWININESIISFDRKIRQCKTVDELNKLFRQ